MYVSLCFSTATPKFHKIALQALPLLKRNMYISANKMTWQINNFWKCPNLRRGGFRQACFCWQLHTVAHCPPPRSVPALPVRSRVITSTTLVARSPHWSAQGGIKYYLGIRLADQIHSAQFPYQIHLSDQIHFAHFSYQIHLADQIRSADQMLGPSKARPDQDPWSKSLDWSKPAILDH